MSVHAATAGVNRFRTAFTKREILRLSGILAVVATLHIVGFGLFLHYDSLPQYHRLADTHGVLLYAGAAGLAYMFGLRHAFDADHIAAIDDTTRLLLQKQRKPLGIGLAFSLGHSTIVLGLSVGVAFAAGAAARFQRSFADVGGIIGSIVSGSFLYLVAGINLVILVGIYKAWQQAKRGTYSPQDLDALLASRGLMNRLFKGRYSKFISHSWQMYPVGVLFGLGFDTASEVGLLGLSAAAAANASGQGTTLAPLAIIALPLIFAAGMSLMDNIDGVFMCKAYQWAFTSPLRKIYYNITTTGLSIFVAFAVGSLELAGVTSDKLGISGRQPWRAINAIDLNKIGYGIVGLFILTWVASVCWWKWRRLEDRYQQAVAQATTPPQAEPATPPTEQQPPSLIDSIEQFERLCA
jgi:nickel/cobalt transporter (NiCoT) family protein